MKIRPVDALGNLYVDAVSNTPSFVVHYIALCRLHSWVSTLTFSETTLDAAAAANQDSVSCVDK